MKVYSKDAIYLGVVINVILHIACPGDQFNRLSTERMKVQVPGNQFNGLSAILEYANHPAQGMLFIPLFTLLFTLPATRYMNSKYKGACNAIGAAWLCTMQHLAVQ